MIGARTLLHVMLATMLAAAAASARCADPNAAVRPNVVMIVTDDQGYGDVGALGNRMIRTPHLDRLHAESIRFRDFHVDPTCSPTRAALLTGRYSTRTGVWHTIMGRSLLDPRELTLAEVMRDAGYRTGMFGKWHLGDNYPLRAEDQGFDEVVRHGGGGVGQGPDWWGNDYFDDTYFHNGRPTPYQGYCTDVWFDQAIGFIERNADQPFFVYLATNAPHAPLLVDPKYSQPYVERGVTPAMARFYGMIENIDENVGRLRARLDELGLSRNTLLVFLTDNGTAGGRPIPPERLDRGTWPGFNAGMRGAKGSQYEGGHRVPLFVHWPGGGLDAGRDVDQLCAHVDLLPTIVELCGIEKPDGPPLDGRSLAPLLRGEKADWPQRTLFVHSQRVPDPIKWRMAAVMTQRWRLIDGRELYDVQADPGQRHDVAGAHPDVVEKLRKEYDRWWESLLPAFSETVAIGIGADEDNPTQLHPHDWHVESQEFSSWNQQHVRDGHMGQGRWSVDVMRAGTYRFELRRWPRHLDQPIEAEHAQLTVGSQQLEREISPAQTSATFELDLPAGRTWVQSELTLPDGRTRGAYFVYVERLR